MNIIEYQEVAKKINILNVAYHLNLEMKYKIGNEVKVICPFCGYKDNKREANLSLNYDTNQYHCFNCGKSGYSIGLYAKLRYMNNKDAFKELLQREYLSIDKSKFEVIPTNEIEDEDYRDEVYRAFLEKLTLNITHKKYLERLGFSKSAIKNSMFKSISKNTQDRQLICKMIKDKYKLEGVPGFFMHENFTWDFINAKGFLTPVFNEDNKIVGLSIHLDKEFNGCKNIWFSSNNRINGTPAKNWIVKNNITEDTETIILTDDLLGYHFIKENSNIPIIAFSNITNSYSILKEIENTNIDNIIFTIKSKQKLDYIIEKVFKDLLYIGYDISSKYIKDYKDMLEDNFLNPINLKVA